MDESLAKKIFQDGVEKLNNNQLNEAKEIFTKLIKLFPDRFSINFNLSIVFYKKQDFDNCLDVLFKQLRIEKNQNNILELLKFLLKIYLEKKDFFKAIKIKAKILKIQNTKENYLEIHELCQRSNLFFLGNLYLEKGYKLKKDNFFLIQKICNTKHVYKSNNEYIKIREKIEKNLKKVFLPKVNIDSLLYAPAFNHSYNNLNNKQFLFSLSNFIKNAYFDDIKKNYPKKFNKKIKIGFVSQFLTNHTIGKLFVGYFEILDKNIFDIYIFHTNQTLPGLIKNKIDLNYNTYTLPNQLYEKKAYLEKFNLDILFYPDVGMSTSLYYLIFFRIAKFQITSWGHPETTGNSEIDYFLTSELLENKNINFQEHYNEKLLLTKTLPMYLQKPIIFNKRKIKKFYKHLYCCPQTIIKLHPDFDEIIIKISKLDPRSKFVFIKDKDQILYKFFKSRIKKKSENILKKIFFINQTDNDNFVNLIGICSVLLDPLYFGSGLSFHESMVHGTPTVTMPTNYIRSRIVLGAYTQMKVDTSNLVALNIDDYVNKAVNLANNYELNFKIREQLKIASENFLFKNQDFADEINRALSSLINNNKNN